MKTYSITHNPALSTLSHSKLTVTDVTHIHAKDQSDWHFPLHAHKNSLEISIVLNGKGTLYVDNKLYPTETGDLIIKNANTLHSEESAPGQFIEQIYLNLANVHIQNFPLNCLLPKNACPVIKTGESYPFYKELFLHALNLCDQKPSGYTSILNSLAIALLSSLTVLLPKSDDNLLEKKIFPVIQEIITYLDSHYYENISLNDLAGKFFFSSYYLARKFKEETGYTINQYIINRRMGEAQRMLIFEDMNIREIARENGFASLQHFYSTFKKYTGCTPIEFRNTYRM